MVRSCGDGGSLAEALHAMVRLMGFIFSTRGEASMVFVCVCDRICAAHSLMWFDQFDQPNRVTFGSQTQRTEAAEA